MLWPKSLDKIMQSVSLEQPHTCLTSLFTFEGFKVKKLTLAVSFLSSFLTRQDDKILLRQLFGFFRFFLSSTQSLQFCFWFLSITPRIYQRSERASFCKITKLSTKVWYKHFIVNNIMICFVVLLLASSKFATIPSSSDVNDVSYVTVYYIVIMLMF